MGTCGSFSLGFFKTQGIGERVHAHQRVACRHAYQDTAARLTIHRIKSIA